MSEKIVLLDGAIGTSLWAKASEQLPVWRYNIECPDIVSQLCQEYIAAGSNYILTNTFSANRFMVKDSPYSVSEVVSKGVALAKEAAGSKAKTLFSIGPLTGLMEPYGDITEEEAGDQFEEMLDAGMPEKPDAILFETFMDISMLKIALSKAIKYDVPIFCTMTFEKIGRTIMGNSVEDFINAVSEFNPAAVGLNCTLTPEDALKVLSMFKSCTSLPLIFKPNAGKPKMENGISIGSVDAKSFATEAAKAADIGATYIGGCCGTNPSYIKALKEELENRL